MIPAYIAIDLETTSREPEQAHVVEWAALVSSDPLHDMQPTMHGSLVKPPVPIPPETSAIHHIIEARRVELRHGTLALVRATFAGFLALLMAIC